MRFTPYRVDVLRPKNYREAGFSHGAAVVGPGVRADWANNAANRHRSRTHKALIDSDTTTGRKLINQYVVLSELGRGVHGKVKQAQDNQTKEHVAIKIIPRFSKKRRLGKVTAMPQQDKVKREIAILKKIRHPNVVALLEIIDDPELQKIYMVLEYVSPGEIVWRKKGAPHICQFERRRIEREMSGEPLSPEEEKYHEILERRQALKEAKRAKMSITFADMQDFWSIEHGPGDDRSTGSQSRVPSHGDLAVLDRNAGSMPSSFAASQTPSRSHSDKSLSRDVSNANDDSASWDDPAAVGSNLASLDGTMFGPYSGGEGAGLRARSPSMADSIISHMSSLDFNPHAHDAFVDDYSYVPCFTIEQARSTFRDTVLGLEYLHYQGVVHRDIKPANLLQTRDGRIKISDFGVSYFGRPIRDGEQDDTVSESEAKDFDDDLELSKTVGTPAFFAPELCYTDPDKEEQPKVSEQIDVWSLGVTLYCLIYARIPFLAEDEFQMFHKIANDPVYIPRRRLRPVDPEDDPKKKRTTEPFRDDNELLYEEIDDVLEDLLRRMLVKDPSKRIRLREIKRHPWVVEGLPDLVQWLEDTDPARPSLGRKIRVDEREMSDAVVPLNFLQRARSAVRKAVGKVIHPLVERDSRARKRATSSVASSAGDTPSGPRATQAKQASRNYPAPNEPTKQPPSSCNSQPTTPRDSALPYDPLATVLGPLGRHAHDPTLRRLGSPGLAHARVSTPPLSSRSPRHSHTRSVDPSCLSTIPDNVAPPEGEPRNMPQSAEVAGQRPFWDGPSRARSVDGSLLPDSTTTKRDRDSLLTKHLKPLGSTAQARADAGSSPLPSPLLFSPTAVDDYQHYLDSNIHNRRRSMVEGARSRPPPARRASTAETQPFNSHRQESPISRSFSKEPAANRPASVAIVQSPVEFKESKTATTEKRPSPLHEAQGARTRNNTASNTTASSRSASTDTVESTPATPGDHMRPMVSRKTSSANAPSDDMLAFQSDPSLPALLSGASSISADPEGELLCRPGVVNTNPPLLESTDSMTPPAVGKDPLVGPPAEDQLASSQSVDSGIISVPVAPHHGAADSRRDKDEESDSDSEDEGLTMMRPRRKSALVNKGVLAGRRDTTNASMGRADTAAKP